MYRKVEDEQAVSERHVMASSKADLLEAIISVLVFC
jgi:hypothetical protein